MLTSALLITASLVLGQAEKPQSNFEHLKALDSVTGEWIGTVQTEDGSEPIEVLLSYEWVLNKNVQLGVLSIKRDDEKIEALRVMRVWDAATKQIKVFVVSFEGAHSHGTATVKDNQHVQKTVGVDSEGKKLSDTLVFKEIEDDSFTVIATDRKKGDERLPDLTAVYKRVKK